MRAATVVLTASPLSRELQVRLASGLAEPPDFLTLSDLRRRSLGNLVGMLVERRRRRWILPAEDETSAGVLPLMQMIAALTLPRKIEIAGPGLELQPVRALAALPALVRLVVASLDGQHALRRSRREVHKLAAAPLVPTRAARGPIAHLNATLWAGVKVGGSIAHVAGIVNELCRRGKDVRVLSTIDPIGIDAGVPVVRLRPPRTLGIPFEANLFRLQRDAVREAQPILRDVSLIYQRLSVGNYTGVVLARALGVPLVLEYNGSEVWAARNWGRPLRYERLSQLAEDVCLRHAQLVVTVSDVLRDELVARGVPASRIVSHPNGVDERMFDPGRFTVADIAAARTALGLAPDDLVVTFMGTFGTWHGVDVLAQAIELLSHDPEWLDRHRVRFMLVGDGLLMPKVRDILAGVDTKYVTFTGLVAQEEAPLHLALSDVLVSPHVPNADGSRFFGSPTKLFEYMAMGKPIVASRLDQIADVLEPALDVRSLPDSTPAGADDVAILATPGNAAELVAGLRFAVERGDWRAALGRAARRRALERYTWRHHVDAILATLPTEGGEHGED